MRIDFQNVLYIGLICIIVGLLGGLTLGWKIYDHPHNGKTVEVNADSVRQGDGSLIIKRVVDTIVEPAQIITKNVYVDRVVQVVVVDTTKRTPFLNDKNQYECPPCTTTVDLTLVRDKKTNMARVIASSPDGTVVSGIDVPMNAPVVSKDHPWSVGVVGSYDVINNTNRVGAYIDRKLGPFRVGAELGGWKNQAYIGTKLGINF